MKKHNNLIGFPIDTLLHLDNNDKTQFQLNFKDSGIEIEDFNSLFKTIEIYPIFKVKTLLDYISDLSYENPLSPEDYDEMLDQESAVFKHRNSLSKARKINIIKNQLEKTLDITKEDVVQIREGNMYKMKTYGFNNTQCIGRIQGYGNCIQKFSRQIRYILFKDSYVDVDLVNAHPTILYAYSLTHNLHSPELKHYIENREEVLKSLSEQLKCTTEVAKKQLLILFNLSQINSDSKYLKTLHKEILIIWEKLWDHYSNSDELLFKYLMQKNSQDVPIEKQKVTLQSLYCQNTETSYLIKLREFISDTTDLTFSIDLKDNKNILSFIPFFDGAYITSTEKHIKLSSARLEKEILLPFNKIIYPMKFELKEIKPNWSFLNEETFNKYASFNNLLNKLTRGQYTILKKMCGVGEICIPENTFSESIWLMNEKYKEIKIEKKKRLKMSEEERQKLPPLEKELDVTKFDPLKSVMKKESMKYKYNLRKYVFVNYADDFEFKNLHEQIKTEYEEFKKSKIIKFDSIESEIVDF